MFVLHTGLLRRRALESQHATQDKVFEEPELLQQGLDPLIFRPVLISVLFQLQLSLFVLPEAFQQLLTFLLKRYDASLKVLTLAGALLLLCEPGA